MAEFHPVREFTARGPCPNCGNRDLHHFITPPDIDGSMGPGEDLVEEKTIEQVKPWGGQVVRTSYSETIRYYRTDQTTCDIIRRCTHCGVRWGEK
ncbi:hypothetical protein [Corynebacterium glyciniphilum]|uniref:hypothetical protein n=1 Tax=Corynebacterium glyciniphilum TaxID=1404244 RepID=UPI00264F0B14|nr:hypothetical protein [Corynebacterium glyciniphilum]MDN6706394.1 hypothetical protein [Corynebacterium glyciniphilum]